MRTYYLIQNEEYIQKGNIFHKTLSEDISKLNRLHYLKEHDLLLNKELEYQHTSIFRKDVLHRPSYFKLKKEQIINLLLFAETNALKWSIENFGDSSDNEYEKELIHDLKNHFMPKFKEYHENDNEKFNEVLEDFWEEGSYLFQEGFKLNMFFNIDNQTLFNKQTYVRLVINSSSVIYIESGFRFENEKQEEYIEQQFIYKIYQSFLKDFSLTPISFNLKTKKPHPLADYVSILTELEKYIEVDDSEAVLEVFKDKPDLIKNLIKISEPYKDKVIEK